MDGVADIATEIRLEVLLEEGSRLVVLREPFGPATIDGPGAVRFGEGDVALVPGTEAHHAHRHERIRTTGARLVALPVHGDEREARVRPGGGARVPARPSGRRLDPLGSGRDEGRRAGGIRRRGRVRCLTASLARNMPCVTDPRPETASDWETRICGSGSSDDLTEPADQALWGYAKNFRSRMSQHDRATSESELDAVIGGAVVVDPTDRRREGRRRHQGRTGRRHRTGGQPRHHRRRRPHDRSRYLADPVPRSDRHTGRDRLARAPAESAAGSRRAVGRRDHVDHGRVRGAGVAHAPHVRGVRAPADEPRPAGVGPHRRRGVRRDDDRGGRDRVEGPRGLGLVRAGDRCRARPPPRPSTSPCACTPTA